MASDMGDNQKPKLIDVAKLAGVSVSTTSRALSGQRGISAKTVREVRAAAAQLGYPLRLSPQESEMTCTLGVIVANIASPFFSSLIESIEESAAKRGYNILLCNSDNQLKKQTEYLDLMIKKQVDGLLIVPVELEDDTLADLVAQGLPVVQIDRYVEGLACDVVTSDNERAVYQAISFLSQQGYQRIAVISGPLSHSTGRERMAGFRKALEENGLPILEQYIKVGGLKTVAGYQLAAQLIESEEPPDAIFVTTYEMAMGVLLAVYDRGMSIPEDIGIVAFDDFPHACLLAAPLTTVDQPVHEIGASAADLIIRRIESAASEHTPVRVQLRCRLIVRNSTRPQNRN